MHPEAPSIFLALEQSSLGAEIRQSAWIYAAANVGHIMGLVIFAGALAVMDLRLLGAFGRTPPLQVIIPARRVAAAAFLAQLATGALLFIADASHIAVNPLFQTKLVLITLGLANALILGRLTDSDLAEIPCGVRLPARLRVAAVLSLCFWMAVAVSGRLIAYF